LERQNQEKLGERIERNLIPKTNIPDHN
jgi:hypothetical protein